MVASTANINQAVFSGAFAGLDAGFLSADEMRTLEAQTMAQVRKLMPDASTKAPLASNPFMPPINAGTVNKPAPQGAPAAVFTMVARTAQSAEKPKAQTTPSSKAPAEKSSGGFSLGSLTSLFGKKQQDSWDAA